MGKKRILFCFAPLILIICMIGTINHNTNSSYNHKIPFKIVIQVQDAVDQLRYFLIIASILVQITELF